jgi:hypothetical protein
MLGQEPDRGCGSRSRGAASSNRVAERAEFPGALLSASARERIEWICQLDVNEPGAADHRFPPCARQGAGDSTSPEIDVAKRFLRDGPLEADVRDCHPASRP